MSHYTADARPDTFILEHPTAQGRNVYVRVVTEDGELPSGESFEEFEGKMLRHLPNHLNDDPTVVIRVATPEEVKYLSDLEMDMEAHEPDIGFYWPEHKAQMCKLINAWENPLGINDFYSIVVSNCMVHCSCYNSAFNHIMKNYGEQVNHNELRVFLQTLNFAAIRENSTALHSFAVLAK